MQLAINDSLNSVLINYMDFNSQSQNIMKVTTTEGFVNWLEKLYAMDKRCLFLYLRMNREHFNSINKNWLKIAQGYFERSI